MMMIGHISRAKFEFGLLSYSLCFVHGCFHCLLPDGVPLMHVRTMEDTLVASHCKHMAQQGVWPIKNPVILLQNSLEPNGMELKDEKE